MGLDAVPVAVRHDQPPPDAAPATAPPPQPTADAQRPAHGPGSSIGPTMSQEHKAQALEQLDVNHVRGCTKCPLCRSRTNTVFGEGDADADLMFIGEGPGADEDAQGRPFVGRAGQLLDKQIAAMGLERQQVFIGNIVKCRPPGNRVPSPEEADACMDYLVQQIQVIQPKVIVGLGATAVKYLLGDMKIAITRLRGQWQTVQGIDMMPTFHPAYLLRQYTSENRKRVWADLQAVMDKLGLARPGD